MHNISKLVTCPHQTGEAEVPYVRKHGHQVAIVHGERDATGKVQQRVLFALYSKPEAEAAIGQRSTDPPLNFRGLMEVRHEGIRFDWRKIDRDIEVLKEGLPDAYVYSVSAVSEDLREGIVSFARGMLAADPHSVHSAAEAIDSQRQELLLLRELIDDRLLSAAKAEEHRFNRDNEFGWLARTAGKGVPSWAEEWLDGMHERGEREKAKVLAGLLVAAWPEYADGYNMLGLIALERAEYDVALGWFGRTMEQGRKLFPKRIAKWRWWTDHDTRPYMRGMNNTILTLLWSGRHEQVLPWCDRLERECFDVENASVHRASALLNLGQWHEARASVAPFVAQWPAEDFVAAFAAFETGDLEDALARWFHAAIQFPRSARMLTRSTERGRPKTYEEVKDHNAGVNLRKSLGRYLEREPALRFFAAITKSAEVKALIDERSAAVRNWRESRGEQRVGYDRMNEMATLEFARERAAELVHLLRKARARA